MEGDILSVSDVIRQAILESDRQQKEVAAHMGWTPQNFSNRLKNNTIDADEWVEIAKFLGYELRMVDTRSGECLREKQKGVAPRTVMMVNGVTYDTEKSEAICHTNTFMGCYFELYKDAEGRYFVVMVAEWNQYDGVVMPISEFFAVKFIEDCNHKTGQ